MTVVVFRDRALADELLREIAATPAIDGAEPVWVWYDPDDDTNVVGYGEAADGRVAIAHHWDEAVSDWLRAYLAGVSGVEVRDDLPADWVWAGTET